MNKIRSQFAVPWIVWLMGIILGILFGLVVLGWWLWPVKWVDASPANLIFNSQEDYMRMNIEAFAYDGNAALAKQRYEALGPNAEAVLAAVIQYPAGLPPILITSFTTQVTGKTPVEVVAAAPNEPPAPWAFPTALIILFALIMLVIIGFFTYLVIDERRRGQALPPPVAYTAPDFEDQSVTEAPPAEEEGIGYGVPLATVAAVGAVAAYDGRSPEDDDAFVIDETQPTAASNLDTNAVTAAVVVGAAALAQGDEQAPTTEALSEPESAEAYLPLDQEEEIIYPPETALPEEPVEEDIPDNEVESWEKNITKPLAYVEGIGEAYAARLTAIGITTTGMLLSQGATRKGRQEISEKSGIHEGWILKWVNHIDLYRVKGVGSEYADLLETSGVDTIPELAMRRPDHLMETMISVNSEKKLVRKLPVLSQVENWVAQAKLLPRIIEY